MLFVECSLGSANGGVEIKGVGESLVGESLVGETMLLTPYRVELVEFGGVSGGGSTVSQRVRGGRRGEG